MKHLFKNFKTKMALLAIVMLAVVLTGCSLKGQKTLKPDEIKAKAESYINDNLMQSGKKAVVSQVVDEGGIYKVVVQLEGQTKPIDSYMSKDGAKFFPQAMDVTSVTKDTKAQTNQTDNAANQQAASVPKNNKPVVELFVMSQCPYGTQIEKGIIPAIQALGNKVQFDLKFCDYAMHGEKEIKENMLQTCIAKEQPDKLFTYLTCYLKTGIADPCLKSTNVDTGKTSSCVAKIDKQYSVTKKFNDKSLWTNGSFPPFDVFAADNQKYSVKGSPTLIVNGVEASAGRDSASLLKTICSAFTKQPSECTKQLSSASPAPGFGSGADTSGGSASGAGCATQ